MHITSVFRLPALALAALLAAPLAFAADLGGAPAVASEPTVAVPARGGPWTGCSVGVSAGYGTAMHNATLVAGSSNVLNIDSLSSQGALIGGRVGCDLQLQALVVGAFADWVNQDSNVTITLPFGSLTAAMKDTWTVGARAGLLVHNVLLYGLLGYNDTHFGDIAVTGAPALPFGHVRGVAFGGGIELPLADNIYLGAEYRYVRNDSHDIPIFGGVYLHDVPDTQSVRATLSYKFGINR